MLTRRHAVGAIALGFAAMADLALTADLPPRRPADFRLTYHRSSGRPRPSSHRLTELMIDARESYLEVRSGPGGPPSKRQSFTMTAAELDDFYAALRKTGVAQAKTINRQRGIMDYPPSSLLIAWGSEKIELSDNYRETVTHPRAWDAVIALIDDLKKRKRL